MAVLKCQDNFESLSEKTFYLFKMLLNSSRLKHYDYIIKMDDDTELSLNMANLSSLDIFQKNFDYFGPRLITSEPKEHDYHFGKCSDNCELNLIPYELNMNLSWGAGHFYILSKHAIKIVYNSICKNEEILKNFLYEDMMIGKILSDNNIEYHEILNRNITTDLFRPRKTSITPVNITKVNFVPKSISNIKKVSFNLNKNIEDKEENIENNDLSDKLKKEVSINRELDKKINELSQKLNKNNMQNNKIEEPEIKRSINPIVLKNLRKITNKIPFRK